MPEEQVKRRERFQKVPRAFGQSRTCPHGVRPKRDCRVCFLESHRRYYRDHRTWSIFQCKDCGRFTSTKPSQDGALCPDCRKERETNRVNSWKEKNHEKYLIGLKNWHKKNPTPKEITRLKWDLFEDSTRFDKVEVGDVV